MSLIPVDTRRVQTKPELSIVRRGIALRPLKDQGWGRKMSESQGNTSNSQIKQSTE